MRSSAIFDLPGPKGQRLITVVTLVSIALIVFGLFMAGRQFQINGQWAPARWEPMTRWPIVRYMLTALGRTLEAAAAAAALALPLGAVLALGRLRHFKPVHFLALGVIEFFRAVPLLLIIYVFFFALPAYHINPSVFWKLVIPISLCEGAVIAEVFRAGILALPKGQTEAGWCVGLSEWQTFYSVVFPQAVRMVVPSLIAQLVIMLKDTTLGYVVSYYELQSSGALLTNTWPLSLVQVYIVISLVYILLNVAISAGARALDARWAPRAVARRTNTAQIA